MTIRKQYRGKHCPACGAIPSAWKKVPKSLVLFGDLDSGGRRKKSVPADRACDYDPVDLIHCESCGFMGTVVQHPEDAEGFIGCLEDMLKADSVTMGRETLKSWIAILKEAAR